MQQDDTEHTISGPCIPLPVSPGEKDVQRNQDRNTRIKQAQARRAYDASVRAASLAKRIESVMEAQR
jgi:hypothetical protein